MSGMPKTKSMDWYVLAQCRRQRVQIGIRLYGAEDKEKELAYALRKKRRNWHARSAEGKEQELNVWLAEDKEWDRYTLIRLSIPEVKVKG